MPCPFDLVLTADPASGALDEVASSIACDLIGATGQWLQPGAAYEIGIADRSLVDAVAVNLAPRPIDVNVVPARHRAKRLFVADMESTVIQQEMIDELAHIAGCRYSIAALTAATLCLP
jgi:phosphoserine phosphatase